ncbi:fatty acyl-AMP ligase [Gordonia jinhuaensis]|uniref:Acyl-CoA synthetase n=1 Tax=Gordonia jinhuaensis TaxID=1517702 RepID=A0A916T2I5_9ACTN|nr:fatty acyl-AMP ligase [Gordonia jinhuaensis]GGB28860.1 acyl-CoA synthetase [Gordonia jinhuaensis]
MAKHSRRTEYTLVDVLRNRAQVLGDKVAFTFSYDGDGVDEVTLTFAELDRRARAIAADLTGHGAAGERVLVLCRPGLDHIAGFFGCLYAGAVAVPVHERLAPRLSAVVPDARARLALGVTQTHSEIMTALDALDEGRDLVWGLMDAPAGDPDAWSPPVVDDTTTAMIQYTSGSTTTPKGVVLKHLNLIDNMESIRESWQGTDADIACLWLPSHHDMGLIGGVLSMVYLGCTAHLMSPTSFVKRPMRWMEALSRRGATYTVAPDFAYQMCVENSTPDERAALDLSHLRTAMNGAEPVRAGTLSAFAEAFAVAGFDPGAFEPVYGLAEATLLVSGGSDQAAPKVMHIDRTALAADEIVETEPGEHSMAIVSCGRLRGGAALIVDPVTQRRCGDGDIGEIWWAASSVGQGYWGRPESTEQTFGAFVDSPDNFDSPDGSDDSEAPCLRTGDLGFLRAGELYVAGRCKDLIVIRGGHHYPHEIEHTALAVHPGLLTGRAAAFAFTPGVRQVEQLVVVVEADRAKVDPAEHDTVLETIHERVAQRFGLQVHSVLVVEPMSIPTTSSGKIQRGECRRRFLAGELAPVATRRPATAADDIAAARQFDQAQAAAEFVRAALASRSQRQPQL